MNSQDSLTWTCHVCGDERPDRAISVYKRDMSAKFNLPPGTVQQNVRYCNDRPECVEGAKTVQLVHPIRHHA